MALGEKLFEATGGVVAFKVTKVHPVEGTTMEISFVEDVKGTGNFPSGKNTGSGTMTEYPHGLADGSYNGIVTMADGQTFMWWAHEKAKTVEGGKMKGMVMISGYTNSQKYAWMNKLIIAVESEFDPSTQQIKSIGYEWK
jgi:hypothetical protein